MALLLQLFANDALDWRESFNDFIPDEELRIWPDVGRLEDIEYAAVFRPAEGLLASLPNLKAIFTLLAGQDRLLSDPRLPGVPIVRTDTPSGSESITETVLMHVLRHYRRLPEYAMQQSEKVWKRLPQKLRAETRVGFLGLGLLGLAAARCVASHGFVVKGWSRTEKAIEGIQTFSGAKGLQDMLAQTDILVNLLPLTPETRGVLNRDALKLMPPGSTLISLGRGEHHPADDLYWALDNGTLSSITLDVFDPEWIRASR
jgi:glyoxylate/hydroxypyruvate reductase